MIPRPFRSAWLLISMLVPVLPTGGLGFSSFGGIGILLIAGAPTSIAQSVESTPIDVTAILDRVASKVVAGLPEHEPDAATIPRSIAADGSLHMVGRRDWTSGFFAGILWQLYEHTGDEALREAAEAWTPLLAPETEVASDHDIGFRINCSYGNGLRLTGDERYRAAMISAAEALAARFDPNVGAIKSWDWGDWSYPVIIDNMMNLELLFEATRLTGDSTYYRLAVEHAETTLEHHFRDDASSYHIVDFDPESGAVVARQTHQGAFDGSAWARGQAWGLYGFTMAYRETGDPRFLERARSIAAFMLDHPKMPDDMVPYWDFDAPAIPQAERDASAGAIMASALLELAGYVESEESARFERSARLAVIALWSDHAAPSDQWPFALTHSVGNHNIDSEVGVPIVYADYYFIEALRRLND